MSRAGNNYSTSPKSHFVRIMLKTNIYYCVLRHVSTVLREQSFITARQRADVTERDFVMENPWVD